MIVIDGSYYLHRCYHAVPPKFARDGQPTNAVFGVINAIHRVIERYNPEYLAVVFDAPEPSFRHKLSPLYKAHRPEYPEELTSQIPIIFEVLNALGVPLVYRPGFEGDDIIGTLATIGTSNDEKVIISTGDKDMMQLVSEDIALEDHFKGILLTEQGVYSKANVYPYQVADWLALIGDDSDGIRGIPGIGPMTAAKLLAEHKSLDGIIDNLDNIAGKVGVFIRSGLENLQLDRVLTKIVTDLDLGVTLSDLALKPANVDELRAIYSRLNFSHYHFAI